MVPPDTLATAIREEETEKQREEERKRKRHEKGEGKTERRELKWREREMMDSHFILRTAAFSGFFFR